MKNAHEDGITPSDAECTMQGGSSLCDFERDGGNVWDTVERSPGWLTGFDY
jgi:hypothetical protein